MSKIFMNDATLEFDKDPSYTKKRRNDEPKVDKMPMAGGVPDPSSPPFTQTGSYREQEGHGGQPLVNTSTGEDGIRQPIDATPPIQPTNLLSADAEPVQLPLEELRILIREK